MSIKSLESTFIYNNLNQSNAITENVMKLMNDGIRLTSKNLEDSLMIINKNFKFPLKYSVMTAFNNGDIILMYGTNGRLPTCLPFFLTKTSNNKIAAVVSVNTYGIMNEDSGDVKIDPKKLYCMMEAAYLARAMYMDDKIYNNQVLTSHGSNIYSMMFTRVLNRKYSLNVDKTKMHKVILLSSKFYLINMLGMADNEITYKYALSNCNQANPYILEETNSLITLKDYTNLETFINALSRPEVGLNMKGLSVKNYLEAFIHMYESSALLALESFPYYIYNLLSVINGAYINNQYIMEDIVGASGVKIYNYLSQSYSIRR